MNTIMAVDIRCRSSAWTAILRLLGLGDGGKASSLGLLEADK
jgi:hypothetical protein